MGTRTRFRGWLTTAVLFSVLLTACTVTFISPYDETLDRQITELQEDIFTFLNGLESSPAEHDFQSSHAFYDKISARLEAMRTRAEAIPKNELTVDQLKQIEQNIDNLRRLHRLGFTNPERELQPVREALNSQFLAIIKLNRAKKLKDEGE